MEKNIKSNRMQLVLLAFVLLFPARYVFSAQSENYKINADVVSVGGDAGVSENYKSTDTIGESVIGIGESETYKDKSGFWPMVMTDISIVVDSESVDLGSHTPGTPVEGQSVVTVTTDSWGGYDLFVSENHNLLHSDSSTTIPDYSCAIISPCAWSGTGLGFTLTSGTDLDAKWGTVPNFRYAYFPESDTAIHEKAGYTSGGDNTTIGYRLDTPTAQKGGAYTNTITYMAVSKL